MTDPAPVVTAVMAARDAAATIAQAIDGVLSQTFGDWELIVVDDGSTDDTATIVAAVGDPRVRLVPLPRAAGRGGARNRALAIARGRYLAVCDADDVSLPDRFALQVAALDADPGLVAVGGQVLNVADGEAPRQVYRYPTTAADVERRFARGQMPLPHQASMIRSGPVAAVGGYSPQCRRAQDLELFLRLRPHGRMTNLDEPVLLYRHPRRTPLKYWLVNGVWRRYAVACADAALAGEPAPTPNRFVRHPRLAAALARDTAGYVRSRLHQATGEVRAL